VTSSQFLISESKWFCQGSMKFDEFCSTTELSHVCAFCISHFLTNNVLPKYLSFGCSRSECWNLFRKTPKVCRKLNDFLLPHRNDVGMLNFPFFKPCNLSVFIYIFCSCFFAFSEGENSESFASSSEKNRSSHNHGQKILYGNWNYNE
jgi:hypothetical protein